MKNGIRISGINKRVQFILNKRYELSESTNILSNIRTSIVQKSSLYITVSALAVVRISPVLNSDKVTLSSSITFLYVASLKSVSSFTPSFCVLTFLKYTSISLIIRRIMNVTANAVKSFTVCTSPYFPVRRNENMLSLCTGCSRIT